MSGCTTGYTWCAGEDVVHSDGEKHYCIFHSPAEHKGVDFESKLFAKLNAALKDNIFCNLDRAVFPSGFVFTKVNKEKQLPSVSFCLAIFGDMTSFSHATFGDEADFSFAKFGDKASFWGARFGNKAVFMKAIFGNEADFTFATFGKEADFANATFGKDASFWSATFGRHTDFRYATFDSGAQLAMRLNKAYFLGDTFKGTVDFKGMFIDDEVRFKGVNFTQALFTNAEVSKMRFESCTWDEAKDGRIIVRDEKIFNDEENARTQGLSRVQKIKERCCWTPLAGDVEQRIKNIEDIYRSLKQGYKDAHNEYVASLFHASEKNMTMRRTRGDKPFYWAMLQAYNLSSGFGENPRRAAKVLVALMLAVFFILGSFGLVPKDAAKAQSAVPVYLFGYDAERQVITIEAFSKTLVTTMDYLLIAFKREMYYDLKPASAVGWVFLTPILVLVYIQTLLFILALRNRLRR